MKKAINCGAAVLLAGMLAACSGEAGTESYAFVVDSTDNNTIEITADKADEGSAASGFITLGEGEHLVVESALESGSITMRWVPAEGTDDETMPDFEGKDLPNPPMDYVITGTETSQYSVEYSEVYILFTISETATGTVHIYTTSEPYEEAEESGQNPVMNFVGTYALDRASIGVAADDADNALFIIRWASSAAEFSEWTMSGALDTETLTVKYDNCVKKNYVFGEDGEVKSEETVYENGTGTITFVDGDVLGLTWDDEQEHIADGSLFQFVPAAE